MKSMLAVVMACLLAISLATVSAQTVTLDATTITDPDSPTTNKVLRDLFDRFDSEHPDIKINWDVQGYSQLQQKLLTAAVAKDLPDFAFVDSIWVQQLAALGALQPLEDIWSAEDRADYKDVFIKGAEYDGQIYAMWDSTDTRVLWYDTTAFEEAGLDPANPPSNWDELMEDAKKLTGNGQYGLALALGAHEYVPADMFLPMFWSLGGELLDADGRPSFHEGENLTAMVKVLEYLGQLQDAGVLPPDALQLQGGDSLYPGLVSGRYAMSIGNNDVRDAHLKELAPDTYENWQAALIPTSTGGQPSSMNGGFTQAIMTDDPAKQQAAWEFISFWNSPEVQLERYKATTQVAVRNSTASNEFFQSPYWQTVNEAVTAGQTRPGVAVYPVISQQIQNMVQQYLTGGGSAEQVVTAAGDIAVAEYERQQQR